MTSPESDFKPGDTVLVDSGTNVLRNTPMPLQVVKVTPTGALRLSDGRLYREDDGIYASGWERYGRREVRASIVGKVEHA